MTNPIDSISRRTFIRSTFAVAAVASLPEITGAKPLAPFKLFDTHAHFYTNEPNRYPFNARGARVGAEKMIAKAMAHPMQPEVVFKLWDDAGIEKGCGVQYNSTYATDNRYLLDVAAEYPKRIVPVLILAPTDPATPDALARMTKENRICGVRFTGASDASGNFVFLSDAALPAWEAANRLGLAIVLMPIGNRVPAALKRVGELAQRYPNVNIVVDHIGFPHPQQLPETFGLTPEHLALAGHKNVYFKYTTLLIEQVREAQVSLESFMHHMVGVYGADHMVWGTDLGNSDVDVTEYIKLALDSTAGLPLTQRKRIFYDTATQVFVPGGRG
jgi:predicted TIM-barrel fold metal-dependent hydrolase